MKRYNGFTIAEIVIALAIISIVSLTAVSLVLASQELSQKTRDRFFATGLRDNSIAVFTSLSDERSSFKELVDIYAFRMNEALGYDMSNVESSGSAFVFTLGFDSNWQQNEENIKNLCTITISVSDNLLIVTVSIKTKGDKIEGTYQIYAEGL